MDQDCQGSPESSECERIYKFDHRSRSVSHTVTALSLDAAWVAFGDKVGIDAVRFRGGLEGYWEIVSITPAERPEPGIYEYEYRLRGGHPSAKLRASSDAEFWIKIGGHTSNYEILDRWLVAPLDAERFATARKGMADAFERLRVAVDMAVAKGEECTEKQLQATTDAINVLEKLRGGGTVSPTGATGHGKTPSKYGKLLTDFAFKRREFMRPGGVISLRAGANVKAGWVGVTGGYRINCAEEVWEVSHKWLCKLPKVYTCVAESWDDAEGKGVREIGPAAGFWAFRMLYERDVKATVDAFERIRDVPQPQVFETRISFGRDVSDRTWETELDPNYSAVAKLPDYRPGLTMCCQGDEDGDI